MDSRRSLAGVAVDSQVGEDSPAEDNRVEADTLVEMDSLVGEDNPVEGDILAVVDTLVADSLSMVGSDSLARSLVAPLLFEISCQNDGAPFPILAPAMFYRYAVSKTLGIYLETRSPLVYN